MHAVRARALLGAIGALLFCALLTLAPLTTATESGPSAAWRRAREAGSYRFNADITQITAPLATVTSVGQQSRQDHLRLEGQANLPQRSLHFTLWQSGGSVAGEQGAVEIKVEGERAFARQGGQDWQEINDFSATFAPSGDFLAFLAAARDIEPLGAETRNGLTFERYAFRVDGPAFAQAMLEQTEQYLREQGKLPAGVQLRPSEQYQNMTGQGELWVGADGLPVRQILTLQFPPLPDRQITASITVDFSGFGAPATGGAPADAARGLAAITSAGAPALRSATLMAAVLLICYALVRYIRSRALYRVFAAVLIAVLVTSPIVGGEPARAFAREQQEKLQAQQQREQQSEMMRTLDGLRAETAAQQPGGPEALQSIRADDGRDLDRDGLSDVQERFIGTNPLVADAQLFQQQLSPQSTEDSDGDGLTDYEESLLGTSSSTADEDGDGVPDGRDTDGDGISDYDEVVGFLHNGVRYYTDPLRADTNEDTIDDGREWQRDTDGDGVPDIVDLDNDGDGVPDRLDLSPFQKQATVFSQSSPLALTIDNLTPGTLSYVEFQLRPTDPKHLWYAFSVFDWPRDDSGQVQDVDGRTFADVQPDVARPADADGDVKFVPMLEIQMPGSASNLPLANPHVTLPLAEATSQEARTSYGGPSGITGQVTLTQQGGNLQIIAGVDKPYQKFYDLLEGPCELPVRRLTSTVVVNTDGIGSFAGHSLAALADGNHSIAVWLPGAPPPDATARFACATIPPLPIEGQQMVDTELYGNYAISVRQQSASSRVAYVPLQLVADDKSGEQVAFYGKMLYQPNAAGWGAPHQVRLVWMVQALVDRNCRVNGTSYICDGYNQPQVIHSYYDTWSLTGLNVREDHGVDVAFIHEDPAVDPDLQSDDALVRLSTGLDRTFLAGRDCDTQTASGVCQGDGALDLSVAEIARRFNHTTNSGISDEQRWNVENILRVQTKSYPHIDAALMGIATRDTRELVLRDFPTTGVVTPTVMFAREERFRALNMDVQDQPGLFRWSGSSLTLDFGANGGLKQHTIAGLNWAPYRYNTSAGAWESAPIVDYWDELKRRYASVFDDEIDSGESDAETAAGKLVFFQLYYLSLYSGAISTVKIGDTILKAASVLPDKPLAATIIGSGLRPGIKYLTNAALQTLYAGTVTEKGLKGFFQFLSGFAKEAAAAGTLAKVYNFLKWSSWTTSTKAFLGRSLLIGLVVVGVVLLAAWGITMLAGHMQGQGWVKTAFAITAAVLVGAVMGFLTVVKPIISAFQVAKSMAAQGISLSSALFEIMTGASSAIKSSAAAAVIGLLIQVGVIWGVVIYQITSGAVEAGSIQASLLIANSIGSTLVAILFFALSLTVAGMILVSLISVVDTVLMVLCKLGVGGSCWGINSMLTQMIANLIYDYQPLLKVKDNDTMVQVQSLNIVLDDPARGIVDGNVARVRARVRTNIEHELPTTSTTGSVLYHANDYLSESNLRSTTFVYRLSDAGVPMTAPVRGSMRGSWFDVRYSTIHYTLRYALGATEDRSSRLYRASAEQDVTSEQSVTLQAGLNRPLAARLTTGYAIPAVECWGTGWMSSCKEQTISGTNTAGDMGLTVDVFPSSLDGFVAFNWDPRLTAPPDGDGDGLRAASAGGNDPDDTKWDTDGDGLSDRVEMELRAQGTPISLSSKDTDGDGLSDYEEVRIGTNPASADTDGDGLSDFEEVNGWLFTYAPGKQTRVVSNPLQPDTDDDGMSDALEKELHERDPVQFPYHPRVINQAPLSVSSEVSDADRFVAPGQTFVFTSTVRNTLDAALSLGVRGTQTHEAVWQISGGTSAPFDLLPDESAAHASTLTVDAEASTGQRILTARVDASTYESSIASNWSWAQPAVSARPVTSGVPWHTAIVAAPAARWGQTYLQAVLQGASGAENSPEVADGRIVVYASDGTLSAAGQSLVLDDGSAPKANDPPDIACVDPVSGADGACLIVWSERRGSSFDVVGALVRPGLASATRYVIASGAADELRPAVAASAGGFLIGWESAGELHLRTLDGPSYTLGETQRLDHHAPGGDKADANIDLAYGGGGYRAVWENYAAPGDIDIWTAQITFGGSYVAGSAQPVAVTAASEEAPRVAYEPFPSTDLVVYRDGAGVRGRMVRGATVLPEVIAIASRGTADALLAPRVERDNLNRGWLVSWLARSGASFATRYQSVDPSGTLRGAQQSFTYQANVGGQWQTLVPSPRGTSLACDASACALSANVAPWDNPHAQNTIHLNRVALTRATTLGTLTLRSSSTVAIDNNAPTSAITSPQVYQRLRPGTVVVIGGTATDSTSYAARVEVSIDGGAWQEASGTSQWSYALTVPAAEGVHTISARATDAVGNVQTSATTRQILVDGTAPVVDGSNIWSGSTRVQGAPTIVATRNADQDWIVPLRGSVDDPSLPGGWSGSGVRSVEVLLQPGGSWQTASITGNTWSIDYQLAPVDEDGRPVAIPNGTYTIAVRAIDQVGNITDQASYTTQTLKIDNAAPAATLTNPPANIERSASGTMVLTQTLALITDTITLRGEVTEPGRVRSGIKQLDIAFNPADMGVAPGNWRARYFNNTTLSAQPALVRADAQIDFDWGAGAPHPNVNADGFAVEWTRSAVFRVSGTYRFSTSRDADGRIQVFLDGNQVLDNGTSSSADVHVPSGLHTLRVVYTEGVNEARATFSVALQQADWLPTALAQSGGGVLDTTWSYQVPADMEGIYQIDLRGTDVLNNVNDDRSTWNVWRGEIDTAAPRVSFDVEFVGVGSSARTIYRVWAADFNLTEQGFLSPCPIEPDDRYYYDTSWWGDWFSGSERLYQIYSECSVPGHKAVWPTVTAYDTHGRSTTVGATPPQTPNERGLYWTDGDKIRRLDLDSDEVTIIADTRMPVGIAVDINNAKIYWTEQNDTNDPVLHWANLDGSNPQSSPYVKATDTVPGRLAIDTLRGLVWWQLDEGEPIPYYLDGTPVPGYNGFAVTGNTGVAIDPTTGWTYIRGYGYGFGIAFNTIEPLNSFTTKIRIGDDSPPEVSGTGTNVYTVYTRDIAFDAENRVFYYVTKSNQIRRVPYVLFDSLNNPDDHSEPLFVPGPAPLGPNFQPQGIALDIPANKIYFTDAGNGKIWRANLDGTSIEAVADAPNSVAVALDINYPPEANDQTVRTAQNISTTFTLDVSDPNYTPLSYSFDILPKRGTLSGLPAEGILEATAPTLVYTPEVGFVGTELLVYTATDGRGASDTAAVLITVEPTGKVVTSAITSPSDGAVITTSGPVTISGSATATDGLKSLSLTANGSPVGTVDWSSGAPLESATWSLTWTPPGEGRYTLLSTLTARDDSVQPTLHPIEVIVDYNLPSVAIASDVITRSSLLADVGVVEITGSASDFSGIRSVQVQMQGGAFADASLGGAQCTSCGWRLSWPIGFEPDGATYPVTARATDQAGRVSTTTRDVTVDIRPPAPVTVTLSYLNRLNATAPISPGETLRDALNSAAPQLTIDWSASSDGSGIAAYRAGWSSSATPPLGSLASYGPDARSHTQVVGEAQVLYAHVVAIDGRGNQRWHTLGPIYVDAPTTPDLIADPAYRGWLQSGASQIGADREVSRVATAGGAAQEPQRFYASWDADALALAWSGASWDTDGDLYIYLDTQPGGAETAFNPYGTPVTIRLPSQDGQQLAADYMVRVEDSGTAQLYAWNGSAWEVTATFATSTTPVPGGALHYRFDASSVPALSSFYIPFSRIGVSNPAGAQLRLVAFATEEDALRLWAAAPDKNPLNSARAINPIASASAITSFALTQQYEWASLGAGIRPNAGQFTDADLQVSLSNDAGGVSVGYLESDLLNMLAPGTPIDADLDGVIDQPLPILRDAAPLGNGAVVTYTLSYVNSGPEVAPNVRLTVTGRGALRVAGGQQVVTIGDVPPGQAGSAQFTATIDTSSPGASAELNVTVADGTHGPFEWFWVQHDVDVTPPGAPQILAPTAYAAPGRNTVLGAASDPSGVTLVELEVTPLPAGAPQVISCADATPDDGQWACEWDAGDTDQRFQLRARATDRWGNRSDWGPPVTVMVDATAPTIALDADVDLRLQTDFFRPGTLDLRGEVRDNNQARQADLCEQACSTIAVAPGTAPVGDWRSPLVIDRSGDGITATVTLYGVDGVGNRSVEPLLVTYRVDDVAPLITLTHQLDRVLLGDYWALAPVSKSAAASPPVLSGTYSDGGGLAAIYVRIQAPDSSTSFAAADYADGTWSYTPRLLAGGRYLLAVEAVDLAGNSRLSGPYEVEVIETVDLAVRKTHTPPVATAGELLTYTLTVTNSGVVEATNVTLTDTLPDEVQFVAAEPGAPTCAAAGGTVECALGSLGVYATRSVTLTVRVDPSFTGVFTNTARITADQTEYREEDNTASDAADAVAVTNLTISKAADQASAVPGELIRYTIVVTNSGPSDARGAVISDTLPVALTEASWTCQTTAGSSCDATSGTGSVDTTVDLQAGHTATVSVVARIDGAARGSLVNRASVAAPAGATDPDTSDNSAEVTTTLEPRVELSISKAGPATAAPGVPITYTVTVTNTGPSDALGATVRDSFPAELIGIAWTCRATAGSSCAQSGTDTLDTQVDLRAGGTATFTITARIADDATGTLTNQASVTAPQDVIESDTSDNSAEVTTALEPAAELAISITAPSAAVPGLPITYTVVVTNTGPSAVSGAPVRASFPPELSQVSWECQAQAGTCPASGGIDLDTQVNLRAGGTATFTVTAQIPSDATGTITTSASVEVPAGVAESDTSDNSAEVTMALEPAAELVISTTAPPGVAPGTTLTYTVVVTNTGPSAVSGAPVRASFPPEMTGIAWTCQAAAGSSCAQPSGTDTLDTQVDLRATGVATFTITAQIPSDATGTITTSASVEAPAGVAESDTSDNTSVATVILAPTSDLAVSISAPVEVRGGNPISYTVVISNAGPSDVVGALVRATLPPGLQNVAWVCAPSAGARCPEVSGSDSLSTTLDLEAGSAATFTISAVVQPDLIGLLTSRVEVMAPAGTIDPLASNNSAEARTALEPVADLAVQLEADRPVVLLGETMAYTATVTNHGPSPASNARLVVDLAPGMSLGAAPAGCAAVGGTVECALGTLASGGSVVVRLDVIVASSVPDGAVLTSSATVSSDYLDLELANNTSDVETTASAHRVFMPYVTHDTSVHAPDLVVSSLVVTPDSVQIVIRNQGTAAVTSGFWVDLYVAPDPVPTGPNQIWNDGRSSQGATWGVRAANLAPGAKILLTLNDASYHAQYSRLGQLQVGTPVYVQVDSANTGSSYGGVLETHEITGEPYNNIARTTVTAAPATAAAVSAAPPREGAQLWLPARQEGVR